MNPRRGKRIEEAASVSAGHSQLCYWVLYWVLCWVFGMIIWYNLGFFMLYFLYLYQGV